MLIAAEERHRPIGRKVCSGESQGQGHTVQCEKDRGLVNLKVT